MWKVILWPLICTENDSYIHSKADKADISAPTLGQRPFRLKWLSESAIHSADQGGMSSLPGDSRLPPVIFHYTSPTVFNTCAAARLYCAQPRVLPTTPDYGYMDSQLHAPQETRETGFPLALSHQVNCQNSRDTPYPTMTSLSSTVNMTL